MFLPKSVTTAAEWQLIDFQQRALVSEPAAAAGTCRAQHGPVPQDELWLVDRMVVSTDSTLSTNSTASLYIDAVDPARMIDGSRSGNFDVADLAAAIQLPGGTILICEWEGVSTGARGTLRLQYQLLRKPTP